MLRKNDDGQVLIGAALALVVLMGFAGLAIDMGVLRYERRLQQSAADAAAIAGASNLAYGGVTTGAQNAAAANGFTDNGSGQVSNCTGSGAAIGTVCVQVNNPPASGPNAGKSGYVEVIVATVQPTYFMQVLGVRQETVSARAVAVNLPGNGCVYALGPSTAGIEGIDINGKATLDAGNCGVVDNGNLDTSGNALTINAGTFSVSGAYSKNGPGGSVNCAFSSASACPAVGAPTGANPLASLLTPPAVGTPVAFSGSPVAGTTYNGISLNGGTTVFPAGTYVISGGNFNVGGNATIKGTGVTFYFTNGATFVAVGTPVIQLSAPTSGSYKGILFYQDPNDANGPSLGGDSSSFYQGAVYFPSATLTFFGNNTFNASAAYTIVVAGQIALSGHPDVVVNSDYSTLGGSIITNPVLSE
jgi:hypothetical protein